MKSGKIIKSTTWHLLIPLLFLVVVMRFYPHRQQFGDVDEGINVMKAMLVVKGYSLYEDIWSDQPPLFTHTLAFVFRFLGFRVTVSRFFVLLLSCMLMWALIQYSRLAWGTIHALSGAILLFLLPLYLDLSVSTMIGLPSLSLAMVSLFALAMWHKQRRLLWLMLSSIALGFSILVKLFTGILAPIFMLGILISEKPSLRKDKFWFTPLKPAILWLGVFSITVITATLLLVGPTNLDQLVEPHLSAQNVEIFQKDETLVLSYHLKKIWPLLFLAGIGCIFSIQSRQWLVLYPIAWVGTASVFLSQNTPVWTHQQLLVTIPVTILATGAVGEAFRHLRTSYSSRSIIQPTNLLPIAALGLFILTLATRVPATLNQLTFNPRQGLKVISREAQLLVEMNEHATETHWVVTDLPMFAFRARLPVPPHLAVFSAKRVLTGNLTEDQVLNTIRSWQPEQVLLGRFQFPAVENYLEQNYTLILSKADYKLYLRRDL